MPMISFWNTLASTDLARTRAFYAALGFTVRDMPPGAGGITVSPAPGALVCFFPKPMFAAMVAGEVCDSARSQELVQSLQVERRAAVDALVARAKDGGGKPIGEPGEKPFGYAGGFADPDGHVWAVLHMPG